MIVIPETINHLPRQKLMTAAQFAQLIFDRYCEGISPNAVSFTAQDPASLRVWQAMGAFEVVTPAGLEIAIKDAMLGGARGFRLDSSKIFSVSYWLH